MNNNKLLQSENLRALQSIAEHYNRIWFIAGFYDIDTETLCNVFLKNGFKMLENFKLPGTFLRLYQY